MYQAPKWKCGLFNAVFQEVFINYVWSYIHTLQTFVLTDFVLLLHFSVCSLFKVILCLDFLRPSQQKNNVETESWGYGAPPTSLNEFYARLRGQVEAIVSNPNICGFCYTQLTDVEQEQNGLYTYDRKAKFDPEWVKSVMSRKAAIED